MRKQRVFVDANAIFPATAVGEWNRLCGFYSVETVEAVVAETQNGNVNRKGYVAVRESELRQTLARIHQPTEHDRAAFRLKAIHLRIELDEGERDLLAYVLAHETPSPEILVLTASDRAAVRACCHLGWADSLVSLDRLLAHAGAPPASRKLLQGLGAHYLEPWPTQGRTEFLLEKLNTNHGN